MNYIGSKLKLSAFLTTTITDTVGRLDDKVFCDIFAGTGIVGRVFKPLVKSVISNDIEHYSYVLNRNYIGNYTPFDFRHLVDELSKIQPKEGFIFEQYSLNGQAGRQYFSEENGKKIDAIRGKIDEWKSNSIISEDQYYFLLASLIESADKIANTASVYGAFLKQLKKSAQKELNLVPASFDPVGENHRVYNEDANELIRKIKGDILYMDPPYNQRHYGANYHLLNTISLNDRFDPKGKTGLREYGRSEYCQQSKVKHSFEDLIRNADFKYIFLSYNNEGLMSENEVKEIMQKYGEYSLATTNYQRFKADKTENRTHKADSTLEYLHILKK